MNPTRGGWVILLTLAVAMLLAVFHLPEGAPAWLGWLRPSWIVLVVFYWVMALPHRFGMISAWITGLLVDVLYADPLGVNGFCLAALTYVTWSFYERFRMYSVAQQGVVVFLLVLGSEFDADVRAMARARRSVVVVGVDAGGDEHTCMAVDGSGCCAASAISSRSSDSCDRRESLAEQLMLASRHRVVLRCSRNSVSFSRYGRSTSTRRGGRANPSSDMVRRLALDKSRHCCARCDRLPVLGADTVVAIDGNAARQTCRSARGARDAGVVVRSQPRGPDGSCASIAGRDRRCVLSRSCVTFRAISRAGSAKPIGRAGNPRQGRGLWDPRYWGYIRGAHRGQLQRDRGSAACRNGSVAPGLRRGHLAVSLCVRSPMDEELLINVSGFETRVALDPESHTGRSASATLRPLQPHRQHL